MPKLCANISMLFNELPFLERYQAAADYGFVGIECLFPYDYSIDEVATAVSNAGIPQVLINTSAGHWDNGDRGLACIATRQEEFQASVFQALDYALGLGRPLVHVMAGTVPPDVSLESAEETYLSNLRWAAEAAKKVGVQLTIEPINPIDMPDYMLSNQAQALCLLSKIDAPNVGLQFDFFHCEKHEGNALAHFMASLDYIVHVQIAGVPQRNEPDTGELDYGPVLAAIDASDYSGFVGCEYRPLGGTVKGLGWMDGSEKKGVSCSHALRGNEV